MADLDDLTQGDRFATSTPRLAQPFLLTGCQSLDWGMQNRLARIFRPATGRTVMLAIDHGYFQGPTTGLERVDLSDPAAAPVRRRADDHARDGPLDHPRGDRSADRAARQRRPERS